MFTNQALKKLLVPLVIEQILVMMVSMADTMMISYAGEAAISGVALVAMIDYLVLTIFSALATGGAVIVSQYLGRKDRDKANLSAGQLMIVSALVSAAGMILCLVLHTGILTLLFGKIETDVMEAAETYFIIVACSFPFLGIYQASAALFRSMQKTNITMYVSAAMNIMNVIGNAIGTFGLHAGVAGVAVSTLVARAFAAILLTAFLFSSKREVCLSAHSVFSWHSEFQKRILRIALPNSIENGLFALGRVLVTGIVALFGTAQIAANGVANSIDQIPIIVVNAVNLAMITVVGQCIGAGKQEQAKAYTKKLMKLSYLATTVLGVAVCALLPVILGLYELSPEAYRYSCILIVMHNILAALLHPTSFNLANSLRASGDVRFTMYVGIGSMLLFRLGSALLFGVILQMGVIGVWIAMGADWTARSAAFVLRYRSGKWKQFNAIK
ncbi:MATE family efflux transporter [Massiliimalia timonensis]|uniref:MATE family efflux transporter n=1 Tax=Massiliimalia timonensis TaxID=1987501 RepID=UPI00189DB46A|nr:MATE family efflux transporter [Massiliimalia timonensis]